MKKSLIDVSVSFMVRISIFLTVLAFASVFFVASFATDSQAADETSAVSSSRLTVRLRNQLSEALESFSFKGPNVREKFLLVLNSYSTRLALDQNSYGRGESHFFTIDFFFKKSAIGPVQRSGMDLDLVVYSTKDGTRVQTTSEILESKSVQQTGGALGTYVGICGLLAAIHSMLDTLDCKWKGGDPTTDSGRSFGSGFLNAVADTAGKSSGGGTTGAMENKVHEDQDLWDCGGSSVHCTASTKLTLKSLKEVRHSLDAGEDCTLNVQKVSYFLGIFPSYEYGHSMHIQSVNLEEAEISTTNTGQQGAGRSGQYEGVPVDPGSQVWQVKRDDQDVIDGPPGFWNELGHNFAVFRCCKKEGQQ